MRASFKLFSNWTTMNYCFHMCELDVFSNQSFYKRRGRERELTLPSYTPPKATSLIFIFVNCLGLYSCCSCSLSLLQHQNSWSSLKNIGPHDVQEAICIWGDTRNNSRSEGTGENTDRFVTDALLRRVKTLAQSRTDWPPLDKVVPQDTTAATSWTNLREFERTRLQV